ncbi:MAG: dTDP-4-dehydrorhamnose reductase [Candidatus Bathyarchaeota archaeon]|nr:dTDP-4-dehydrorhamnose reductase [Candidatus Bathyarchaeota archaeon]
MKLLITGASGLFGSKLAEIATSKGYDVYSGYSKDKPTYGVPTHFDITEKIKVEKVFSKVIPEVVVHAATLTDVDKCEVNKDLAWKINVEGTKNIVEAAKKNNAFLVYVSTDYVFNGEKGNYKETDPPEPLNYYGLTKLKSEELVENTLEEHCVVRASVIYGAQPAAGKINFALWLINKLENKESPKVLVDQWNSPTLNTNMANMTLEIIERKLTGIYHISGATRISRYEFAKELAQTFHLETELLVPTNMTQFSWPAKRPKDSSLDITKAQQTLKNKPLQAQEALEQLKKELNN